MKETQKESHSLLCCWAEIDLKRETLRNVQTRWDIVIIITHLYTTSPWRPAINTAMRLHYHLFGKRLFSLSYMSFILYVQGNKWQMTHKHFIYNFAAEFQLMSDSLIIDGVFIILLVILKLSIAGQTFFTKSPLTTSPPSHYSHPLQLQQTQS